MISKFFLLAAICLGLAVPTNASANSNKLMNRSAAAAQDLQELMNTPDRSAPISLINHATCIAVIPGLKKAGFGIGAEYGRGLASCRMGQAWSAPEFIMTTGGSVGFQIGLASTDVVLVFVTPDALNRLSGGNFTLGGDATLAAGPVGRDLQAGTDYKLDSEIYSYARSKGAFAGIAVSGAVLQPDDSANRTVYGANIKANDILTGAFYLIPAEVQGFIGALNSLP